MTLLWGLTACTMRCLVVTALYIFIACHLSRTLCCCHVSRFLCHADVHGSDVWPRLRWSVARWASTRLSRGISRLIPPSSTRPFIFPEPVATLSSPGLRTLTHRHFLITRASLAALSVLPDNSKYVPIWWSVVRQSINNSFPRTRISQMYSLSH